MAGLPSHLFVVRHGNRLDAADKRWHLSSPTPYDPPLTYGGWLQARQVGVQISNYLEQAKNDAQQAKGASSSQESRRKRFRVVIHSSPFLRCVQTSIAISSGLAQSSPDSAGQPADLLLPVPTPAGKTKNNFRSSILRLDSFLGEWLSPEYFENITPPPSSSLMLGTAKADLLKREDYSIYTDFSNTASAQQQPTPRKSSLWNGSPDRTPSPSSQGPFSAPGASVALPGDAGNNKGYNAPRATYAVSSAGKIPDGFVAHARDQCLAVDYQWDSMRESLGFGDGGNLGEEWTTMHRRFRGGLKRMLDFYANTDSPERLVSTSANGEKDIPTTDEDVETVVIMVSHGAGCNALIGAITHQPVLMDVGIASITMASRKENLNYAQLHHDTATQQPEDPLVPVDRMYDIRLSASTEHLHSTMSTPVSARSGSIGTTWSTGSTPGNRGRTSTLGTMVGPSLGAFTYNNDPLSAAGSRSSSANAAVVGTSVRRDSGPSKTTPRQSAMASVSSISSASGGNGTPSGPPSPSAGSPSVGLWTPTPSSLRMMDDGSNQTTEDEFKFPNFDGMRLDGPSSSVPPASTQSPASEVPALQKPRGPRLAGPIKLQTNWEDAPPAPAAEEVPRGLWGQPMPPEVDTNQGPKISKRRWTVNERTR
ncbi:uncharacterized protein J7T54_004463 [Emericellopsis cladophorae]|uniref:Phosphoglycerate mutase family protein n=1 Tax=Emericellopsis cladophorae TaxID=2686198 RepID=A0A9P9Y4T7_9HYPO|nr:uncharacterized protein J7T54_004463 [Emericellopsis cladophorae]KAI6783436.1 hypothetical protein J7T54_004463 [Emericellopsis cladophorae]